MSTPELICPRTERPCQFAGYCALNKALAARDPSTASPELQGLIDDITKRIPAPLLEAQRSSYCSEERILAIGQAAGEMLQDPELEPTDAEGIQKWMITLVQGTLVERQKPQL